MTEEHNHFTISVEGPTRKDPATVFIEYDDDAWDRTYFIESWTPDEASALAFAILRAAGEAWHLNREQEQ